MDSAQVGDERDHRLDDVVGRATLGGGQFDPVAQEFAAVCVDEGTFNAGAADIDAKRLCHGVSFCVSFVTGG